jgi:hypothetical protein
LTPFHNGGFLETDGKRYCQVNTLTYTISAHHNKPISSLIDHGANGGLAGADVRVLERSLHKVDISGIDNNEVNNLAIVTATGLVHTLDHVPVIAIVNQYAYYGQGKTIHSSAQIEHYKHIVDDRVPILGGKLCIVTLDRLVITLTMKNGLAYLNMRPPSDTELTTLPHIILILMMNGTLPFWIISMTLCCFSSPIGFTRYLYGFPL